MTGGTFDGHSVDAAMASRLKLAVGKVMMSSFDKARWLELARRTDAINVVRGHPHLLRALLTRGDDYTAAVHEVLPAVLGERRLPGGRREFVFFDTVASFIGLEEWLATNDRDLCAEIYGGEPTPPGIEDEGIRLSDDRGFMHRQPGRRQKVFLVHGRDGRLTESLIRFLEALGIGLVSWEEARAATGQATPYVGEIVASGLRIADAVVVLFTPDDLGCLHPDLDDHANGTLRFECQPRLNVVLEAGMALALNRDKVIIVRAGALREISDLAGLHDVRLGQPGSRTALAKRLETAGLDIDQSSERWLTAGDFEVTREPLVCG
ncbi:MAG TPA: TIR domain-containing protein [Mycobacteriales bacterium]|jgi:predicted nucleotide-binding protein